MPDIPALALERLARLRRLYDLGRASADGLSQPVDDARRQVESASLGLMMATRAGGVGVVTGEDGLAYARVVRERTSRPDGSGAAYVLETTGELRREPKYDAVTLPIHAAKARLAELMSQRREALERATAMRRGVEAIEAELRKRGWREGLETGEGMIGGPSGPTIANAVRPREPGMFSPRAR